ncbi:MAG: class I SAM-dependent methyltransferase [Candidatus Thiodiazotropha sp.]
MATRWRGIIKRFHPEAIPWPASLLYNAISGTGIFLHHYQLVAQDLSRYGPADRLLDIGTGPGRLLFELRRVFPDTALYGVDISPAMVEQANKNLETSGCENIELDVADAKALPYADGSFDLVISTGSLHHWKDPIDSLSELYRITKPGGYALMYDLVRTMPQRIRDEVRARYGGFRLALLWLHSFEEPFYSPEEMEALGRSTDYKVEGTGFVGALCCLILRKRGAVG